MNRAPCHWIVLGTLLVGCKDSGPSAADGGITFAPLRIDSVTARTHVADQMRTAIEMQLSGEPLAAAMGRTVAGFVHYSSATDQYQISTPDMGLKGVSYVTDTAGFSTAIESYEYSKMAMNHLSFESGAGLSLMYGPRLNPSGQSGAAALGLLRNRVQTFALASRAGATSPPSPWVVVPAPSDNPLNRLGFPGLWPQFAEFRSYDPTLAPSREAQSSCTNTGANGGVFSVAGYAGSASFQITDYECSSNSLHLVNRDAQVEKVLQVDALGLSAWKQALWVINYFQLVHDVSGLALTAVDEIDISQVGQPGNTVQARDGEPPTPGMPGTYIGSTDLEGFQGLLMTEEIDNKAELLLKKLTTSDGVALGGFASLKSALAYDYQAPLRYFPHAVAVSEQPGSAGAEPQPSGFAIQDGGSQLADLTALLGAYSEMFALTDRSNAQVGGSSTVRPVFDGDPFPSDNGLPDGEQSPHDRALALLKVALVNLDRLHVDPKSGILCDSAQVDGAQISRSSHATTVEIAYALVALRTAYRALTSQLTLYSDATPDRIASTSALDGTSMAGAPGGATVAARLAQLIAAHADFLSNKLLAADGLAHNGYNVATGTPDASPTTLESQAAAVRALFEAYLSTSREEYRARAQKAYEVLDARFYHPTLRIYRPVLDEERSFVFTAARFGILQSALRQMYIHVGARPGNEAVRAVLEQRLGRLNKLVLNGWDDRNGNDKVDYPSECMLRQADVSRGGLQMGERWLTGEISLESDFDRDCVPSLSWLSVPATLAAELRIVPAN